MPILIQYLLKVSISLAIMYLFYQLVLRRLTFYNHNRWYLFGYSVLCFFISLINIGPILEKSAVAGYEILNLIPAVESLATNVSPAPAIAGEGWTAWSWLLLLLIAGTGTLVIRLVLQLISFRRLTRKAKLISGGEIRFYQVGQNIIPFSFGNSIFINQYLHTESELKEIIRHEFVHVKQGHTADIIWSEILCILNWYNPFAWLIKKAIRQNLEFIADNKVIANGVDKRQYQYLLLKVIGNSNFKIAAQFNFSSLKKRIVMMNKIKSAKVHLLKFLFILPLLAVLLLAFRNKLVTQANEEIYYFSGLTMDAKTETPLKGVIIEESITGQQAISDNQGYFKINLPQKDPKFKPSFSYLLEGYTAIPIVKNITLSSVKNNINPNIAFVYLRPINERGSAYSYSEYYPGEPDYKLVSKKFEIHREKKGRLANVDRTVTGSGKQDLILPDTIPAGMQKQKLETPYSLHREDGMPSEHKLFFKRNQDVNLLHWKMDGSVQVYLKGGKFRTYSTPEDFKKFEAEYGPVPPPYGSMDLKSSPASPVSPSSPVNRVKAQVNSKNTSNARVTINNPGIGDGTHKPIVFVDGKEWPADIDISIIDGGKIESVNVFRGEAATSRYGNKGKDGVISIVTKQQVDVKTTINVSIQPVYFLNGKKVTKQAADLLDPARIKSIDVLKGNTATQKYGEDGKNGVIEITTTVVPTTINNNKKTILPAWDIRSVLPVKKKDEC